VNKVLARLNEVPLSSSTFSGAGGFYAHAKEAVNAAVHDITRKYNRLPFLHLRTTFTTTAGVNQYSLSGAMNPTDWDTFYVVANSSATPPIVQKALAHKDYNEYMNYQYANDVNAASSLWSVPRNIIQDLTGNGCLISPFPDTAYTISYEAWQMPTDMVNYSDVCILPTQFDGVVVDCAMYYALLFRENLQAASAWQGKWEDGAKSLVRQIVPQDPYMKSPMIGHPLPLTGPTRVW